MKVTYKLSGTLMIVLVFTGFLILTLDPRILSAEISVDSYCQLSIQSIQQQIPQTQELIAIVNQFKDNPETLNQQLEIKRAEFDQAKEALYSSFDTTAEEYVNYMSKNGTKVKAYLDANPDIKEQIDDLSAQLNALMEEEESLMGAGSAPKPPLP